VHKKRLTTQEIYQDLCQQIINFELFPGSRFTETELASLYKTSRTPIREALKRLEVEGLVIIKPKQGCFVRDVDIELISDYYTVRVALEAMAVELACENMPRHELQALADKWNPEYYKQKEYDLVEIKENEENFHISIAEGSGNIVLVGYLNDVNNRIRPIRLLGFPDEESVVGTYDEHFEICTFMLNGEKDKARDAMMKHIRKSQKIASTVTLLQLEQYKKANTVYN